MSLSFLSTVRRFPAFLPSAKLAAVALVAMLMAGPVVAQTTITTNGLSGDAACDGGYSQQRNLSVTGYQDSAITNTNLPFSLSNILDWTAIRGLLGIADNPVSSIAISAKVINARTGTTVRTLDLGTVTSTQNPSYTTTNVTLTERTPYVVIMYTDFGGHGEDNPFSIKCFMTGGSYTITNLSINNGSNGCFSISPLTPLDARNCLCGRPATGTVTIDGSAVSYDYSSIRSNWGCK